MVDLRNPSSRHDAQDAMAEWDEPTYTRLSDLIGHAKADAILARFATDLAARFAITEREALRRDAHAVISTAGMLGFLRLSALARDLEAACSDGADVDAPFAALQRARDAATTRILLDRHRAA